MKILKFIPLVKLYLNTCVPCWMCYPWLPGDYSGRVEELGKSGESSFHGPLNKVPPEMFQSTLVQVAAHTNTSLLWEVQYSEYDYSWLSLQKKWTHQRGRALFDHAMCN